MPAKQVVAGQRAQNATVERAKELRRKMSRADPLLWQRLRAHRLAGLHFRRQQVISRFIVDFYCHSAALVIDY